MFVLYPRKFSLIKYIRHKNVQKEHGEPFYKKVYVYMFLKEHVDFLNNTLIEIAYFRNLIT